MEQFRTHHLPDAHASWATGINDRGETVGYDLDQSNQEHRFVYDRGGYVRALPRITTTLRCHEAFVTSIYAITATHLFLDGPLASIFLCRLQFN